MAVCTKCGSTSAGKFCAQCGAPMPVAADTSVWGTPAGGPSAAPGPSPEQARENAPPRQDFGQQANNEIPRQTPPPYTPSGQATVLDENVACALCYSLWFLTGILFLILEPYKNNRLIRFHAFQSIFSGLAVTCVFWVLSSMVFVPGLGLLFSAIFMIYPLAGTVLWAVLMYKAYMKERWVLPFVGPLAEKQA
ncbi:MAG: hypothetical protein ABI824_10980 [Acidobacteriota bacterium]